MIMTIEDNFKNAPQNKPIYLIDNYHNLYIGTVYKKNGVWYRGECLKGDPDCFYRFAIVNWAIINKE